MTTFNNPEVLYRETREESDFCVDDVSLSYHTIDLGALINDAKSPRAGAISTFFGTTRDNFEGKHVTHLEYEAYPTMALPCMLDICKSAREKWSIGKIIMQHKLGPCPICEVSIAIIISSEHRQDALAATKFAIDELKLKVPIWKKEHYDEEAPVWKANAKPTENDVDDGEEDTAAAAKK